MMDNLLIQAWKSLGPVFRFWRIVLTELVLCARSLTKEERRRLFALRVAQEDEEMRMRRYQEEVWKRHLEHCMALGLDPTVNSLIPSLFQLRLLFEITVCFRFIDSLINFSFFFLAADDASQLRIDAVRRRGCGQSSAGRIPTQRSSRFLGPCARRLAAVPRRRCRTGQRQRPNAHLRDQFGCHGQGIFFFLSSWSFSNSFWVLLTVLEPIGSYRTGMSFISALVQSTFFLDTNHEQPINGLRIRSWGACISSDF